MEHLHRAAGRLTKFYDWGDGVVAHPFASLLVGLGFMRRKLGLELDDHRVLRARDAYLEVFEDLAPRSELVRTLELASRVAKIARVLTWQPAIEMVDAKEAAKLSRAPLSWPEAVLDSQYPRPSPKNSRDRLGAYARPCAQSSSGRRALGPTHPIWF